MTNSCYHISKALLVSSKERCSEAPFASGADPVCGRVGISGQLGGVMRMLHHLPAPAGLGGLYILETLLPRDGRKLFVACLWV